MRIASCFYLLSFSFIALSPSVFAQSKSDHKAIKQLKADIGYLASDELGGRQTGSAGEHRAGDYIIKAYEAEGIKGYKGQYRYSFHFVHGKEIGASTQIRIDDKELKIGKEAFPAAFSANKKLTADVLPDVQEQGNAWLIPLYQSAEEAANPHFDWEQYAYNKSKEAIKQGATGVMFYDGYNAAAPAGFNALSGYDKLNIPVAFLSYDAYKHYVNDASSVIVGMNIDIAKTNRTGNNIAAFIDNGAKYTVILGAHYDHLGYGEESSLYTAREKKIHPGADDNASGTAALLQLAKWIKKDRLKHYNYLFLNFSGEEYGLVGSKAFVTEQGIDSAHTAYMINMDMVGRLNDSTHALTIGGYGTSPVWSKMIATSDPYFRIQIDSSGIGPSDHTSFYLAHIPVLFFFTGIHSDYHKPTDVTDKINFDGELKVMHYIHSLVKKMDNEPKPKFTPTKMSVTGKIDFKVTLGIMPDYTYQGNGVRVDGVVEGKVAEKAGIMPGDIIVQLDNKVVKNIQSYMEALSKFKSGDKTTVTIMRGNKKIIIPVQFR